MVIILPHTITLDHLPDEHLRGVGLVAISWAFLEGAIERIVWRAAGLEENKGIAITTHTNIQTRLDMAKTLLNKFFPNSKPAKQLKSLDKHIRKILMPLRNEIVHSRIIALDLHSDPLRAVYKARGELKRKTVPIKLEEYETVSKQILAAANKAREIYSDVFALIQEQDRLAVDLPLRGDEPHAP